MLGSESAIEGASVKNVGRSPLVERDGSNAVPMVTLLGDNGAVVERNSGGSCSYQPPSHILGSIQKVNNQDKQIGSSAPQPKDDVATPANLLRCTIRGNLCAPHLYISNNRATI